MVPADKFKLLQAIRGRVKPITAPSGVVYQSKQRGDVITASSQEDYDWLISLRMH